MSYEEEDIQKLIEAGAHLLKCKKDKSPSQKTWKDDPWNGEGRKPQLIGLVPASLGLCVVDIDQPKNKGDKTFEERRQIVCDAFGDSLFNIETRSGGLHAYYAVEGAKEDYKKWIKYNPSLAFHNRTSPVFGDFRGSNGYVVLWNDAITSLLNILQKKDIKPIKKATFLKELDKFNNNTTKAVGEKYTKGRRNNDLYNEALAIVINDPEPKKALEQLTKKAEKSGLPEDEIKRTIESALKIGMPKRKELEKGYVFDEIELAEKIIELRAGNLSYIEDIDKGRTPKPWIEWEEDKGFIWKTDNTIKYGIGTISKDKYRKRDKSGKICENPMKRCSKALTGGALDYMKGNVKIQETLGAFNANPNLLGCENCEVLDLKTYDFRKQTKEDRVTMISGACRMPTESSPFGEEYKIEKLIQDKIRDPKQRDYFYRHWGYTTLGHNEEQKHLWLIGGKRTGKTTIIRIMSALHGQYRRTTKKDIIVSSRGGKFTNERNYSLIKLPGKRLWTISELDEDDTIDIGLFNALTGGDEIEARDVGLSTLNFDHTCKLVIASNYLPKGISEVEDRLVFIEMDITHKGVSGKKGDSTWKQYIESPWGRAEATQLAMKGLREYRKRGLSDEPKKNVDLRLPPDVLEAKNKLDVMIQGNWISVQPGKNVLLKRDLAKKIIELSPNDKFGKMSPDQVMKLLDKIPGIESDRSNQGATYRGYVWAENQARVPHPLKVVKSSESVSRVNLNEPNINK